MNEYVHSTKQIIRGLKGQCICPTDPCIGCPACKECWDDPNGGVKKWAKKFSKSLDFILGVQ